MILVIDHYDSFIDMICDYINVLGYKFKMVKTDELSEKLLNNVKPSHIIIGPGPGHPSNIALTETRKLIGYAVERYMPLLGICLGHQLIAEFFNARVINSPIIAHGEISQIKHNGNCIFNQLPTKLNVTRYHSLIVAGNSIKTDDELVISAVTETNEIMAIEHRSLPIYGIQFHPESIMTEFGHDILANFLKLN